MNTELTTILSRGVEKVIPLDLITERLSKGEKLKVYAGIDPTGPTLHIGHAIVLRKLQQLQKAGHQITLLIGDFTAQIGDPTDKMAARVPLTEDEVKKNLKLYKKQAEKFINFSGKNSAKIVFNSKWLRKLDLKKIIEISSLVTVDQMLKRDMFVKRIEENKPIFIHEFLYPLLQGYDSVMLDVDVEVGGNDQMFNMLMGRDLQKKINNREKTAINMKLLTDPTGKKMGKTEGNIIALTDSAQEMFGKVMSWSDGMIYSGFELCTDVSEEKLAEVKNKIEDQKENPRDLKMELALNITGFYHGDEKAEAARMDFFQTFSKGDVPKDMAEVRIPINTLLSKALFDAKVVESIGEFKRLVGEGAVTILEDNGNIKDKITDFGTVVNETIIVKVGKRRFVKLTV